ncbi:hypothetical protein BN1180_03000 [Peribacillus simplex]|uniref:Uncharacterized protein n=1 Tax=Peribacillus simplex TaxID=1478 RepID=A0AAN2TT19_9BACI|nr:hypothetical protein CQ056_09255 [Peribacillus simplex]CEG32832.1 hypothetical protein BN1180_03000 [Peribacillus simplex]
MIKNNDQKNSDPSGSLFQTVDKFEESEFVYSILWMYNLDVDFRFGHSLSAGGPPSAPLRLRGLP